MTFQDLKNKIQQSQPETQSLISDRIKELLNYRIQREELSSRIYLAMSIWLEDKAYLNSAKLWKKNADEELTHAQWAREYLLSLNLLPETRPLEEVQNEFESLGDIIRKSLEHEILITQECSELAKACMEEGDFLCFSLAQKYIAEQKEELQKSYDLLNLLDSYGEDKLSLALLDSSLSSFL